MKRRDFIREVTFIIIPVMLQQLIVTSVNLIDNLMVGQLGDVSLSGVNAANRFYMIESTVIFGIIGACMIFLSQFYGSNNKNKLRETFSFTMVSSFVIALVFFIIAFFFSKNVIAYFSSNPEVIESGSAYLNIVAFTYLPVAVSFTYGSSMRSLGETKIPLMVAIIAVVTNTLLNYILIFGHLGFPVLGIKGAAIATLIARIVELTTYVLIVKFNNFNFVTKFSELFCFSKTLARKIIIKAMPLVANEFLWSFGMATLIKFYGTRGVVALTGQSIAQTTSDIFYILFSGMAVATTIMVGQKLGAGKLEAAKKNAYSLFKFSIALAVIFGVLLFISSFIVPEFYNVSAEAKHIASSFLKVQGFLFWIYMFVTQCYFIMRAGGDTKSTFIMDSVYMWLVNIPIVLIVTYFTKADVIMIYAIAQSTDFVKMLIAYHFLRSEQWINNLAVE